MYYLIRETISGFDAAKHTNEVALYEQERKNNNKNWICFESFCNSATID
jgi:hypothetical protein